MKFHKCNNMHLDLCADKDACSCACHTWSTGDPQKLEKCAHDIHAPHKVGYGSTWCPGVADKLGPMNPKEMQQVEDGVVARYFPHLANETIAELADHLVRVVMDSFNDDGSVNEYRLRQTFGDVLSEEMAK